MWTKTRPKFIRNYNRLEVDFVLSINFKAIYFLFVFCFLNAVMKLCVNKSVCPKFSYDLIGSKTKRLTK